MLTELYIYILLYTDHIKIFYILVYVVYMYVYKYINSYINVYTCMCGYPVLHPKKDTLWSSDI